MSSNSLIVVDETSNQSVEIPSPPALSVTTNDKSTEQNDLPKNLTFDWFDEQIRSGVDMHRLLSRFLPTLPADLPPSAIFEILMDLFLPVRERQRLEEYQTLDDAVKLIRTSRNILVLTGAGISVSCGIPDFRSRNGIYARLRDEFPELPNPQSMFDIEYFSQDPRPFFRFAKEIWPGQYRPSIAHEFIAELERRNQLLRNYTQNIDSLEHLCSITRLIQCHGSFSTSTCRRCAHRIPSDEIKDKVFQQIIPHCSKCSTKWADAIFKPDIVFFGESLPVDFHRTMSIDKDKCDLLIVMGSSLKVKPVSLVSEFLPSHIPQILINRERLPHKSFDIELLGNCDVIIRELCLRLAIDEPSFGRLVPQLNSSNFRMKSEIHYENLRSSLQKRKRKRSKISTIRTNSNSPKERLSSLRPRQLKTSPTVSSSPPSSSSSSRKRPFSALKSTIFNPNSSFLSYPPRRYLFTGAEIHFSSDEDDETSDDDLKRKHLQ